MVGWGNGWVGEWLGGVMVRWGNGRWGDTRDTALQIYKTKVIPYLDHGDILYMGTHKETQLHCTKLQRKQNRALKICIWAEPRYPTDRLHFETKRLMLEHRKTSLSYNLIFKRKDNIEYVDMSETGIPVSVTQS